MKKVLLAFDGSHFSEAALDFAREMNAKQAILLTGAFLPQVDFASLWTVTGSDIPFAESAPMMEDSTSKEVRHNIQRFESYCRQNNIRFKTHHEFFNFAIPELKAESRFADILIVSSQEFYKQAGTELTNPYLADILQGLECPLIVIPEKHCAPSSTILMYDGTAASVFAIRQFAYLFPEWAKHPTTVLHTATSEDAEWPHEQQIRELVTTHFPQAKWELLVLKSGSLLTAWLAEHQHAIVVSGSFGRSGLSMLFRKSYITGAINDHQLPVFIAHK
ncbi:MAG: universal stress protein [Chitinophagaceae bacterium]|nr:MAG: universal stress protein [Chitinophagaceae bacterium]